MNAFKPPQVPTAGRGILADKVPMYNNLSTLPPTSGVAALLHHSGQGSQFSGVEDERQKRLQIRDKERERRRLGLSAPDNYGGAKDKSFSLNRNLESQINIPGIQKIDPYMQQQQPYMPPQIQQQLYQPPPPITNPNPLQASQQQHSPPPPQYQPVYHQPYLGGPQQPLYPPPQQPQFLPQAPQYLPPQLQPPPQQQLDFSYSQHYPQGFPLQPQQPQPQQFVQQVPLNGRQGGQPRQGQQAHSLDARESFFDKFGQQDNERTMNAMNAQDKAKRLRMELDQQVQEKNKRKEEERLERERWELKYGEGSWINQQAATAAAGQNQPLNVGGQQVPGAVQNFQQFQPGQPLSQIPGQQNLPGQPQQPVVALSQQNNQPLHSGIQVHQLPGGGTSVAHGAVPDGSPARNQSQVDAYKNELMVQIEEKKKKQEAEKKRKQEEDEKDEMRVKKEMEDLQKKYQAEINPEAAAAQQQQEEIEAQQKAQAEANKQQQNHSGARNGDQGPQGNYANQSRRVQISRRQGPDSRAPEQYDRGYSREEDGFYQNEDQRFNQSRRGGPQQNGYYDQNRQGYQNNRGPQGQRDEYNDYGPEEYYQNEYQEPYYEDNRNSPSRRQGEYYNDNYRQGPPPQNQNYRDGPPAQGRGPQNQMMNQMPMEMMPPPFPLPNLDPFKFQLQNQLTTFQKDIMRLQNQQKSMMRNYHKEIEMLQRKKQQILSEMKTDQDSQMKLQIQQLSSAIQLLSNKVSRRDQGLAQSLSPRRNEIVAEVINELKTVLPLPQTLQYQPMRYSSSLSPPPLPGNQQMLPYSEQQDPYYSELPMQINAKNQTFTQQPRNIKGQNDLQLPSTTVLMPHDSPRYQQLQYQLQQQELNQQYSIPLQPQNVYGQSLIQNPNAPNIGFPEIEDHTSSLKQKAEQLHNHPLDRDKLQSSMHQRARPSLNVVQDPATSLLQDKTPLDNRSSLQLKASQLKTLNELPRTSKILQHPLNAQILEEIAEEDDRGQTPISDENTKANAVSKQPSLKHKPSITSMVSNSARYKDEAMQDEEDIIEQPKPKALPRQDIKKKKEPKDKKEEVKEVLDEIATKIISPRAPQQQRKSVIDQIRYKNQQAPQQVPPQQSLQQERRNSNASKIDPRQRPSIINQESDPQRLAQQIKNKKQFEMKEQKPFVQKDLPPYIVSQQQASKKSQSGQIYNLPSDSQKYSSDFQQSRIDQDQVIMKSLQLASNQMSHQALSDSLDSLRRQEKLKEAINYKSNHVSQLALKDSLDSLRMNQEKEQETEMKSVQITNMAIGQALDSIRRVEELVNVRTSQLTNEVLYEALDSIRRMQGDIQIQQQFPQYGQQLQLAHDQLSYLNMQGVGGNNRALTSALPQQRGKFNQSDVNEALNSIKQVHATLEAKNLLYQNPQIPGQRMSVPPYAKLAEERPLTPIEEEVKQQIKILQNNLFSPYRNPYEEQQQNEEFEDQQELGEEYSERFDSDNQQALQNQYYQSANGQPLVQNPFVGAGQVLPTELDEYNKFYLSSQNSPDGRYEQQNLELRAELPKLASQNFQKFQDQSIQQQMQIQELMRQSQMLQQQLHYQQMQNQYNNQVMASPIMQYAAPYNNYDEEFQHLAKEDSAPPTANNPYTYTQSTTPMQDRTPIKNSPLQQQMIPHNMIINVSPPHEIQSNYIAQLITKDEGYQVRDASQRQSVQQSGQSPPRSLMEQQPYPVDQIQANEQAPPLQMPSFIPQKVSPSEQAQAQLQQQAIHKSHQQALAEQPNPFLNSIQSQQEPIQQQQQQVEVEPPVAIQQPPEQQAIQRQPSAANLVINQHTSQTEAITEQQLLQQPSKKIVLQVPPWRSAYPQNPQTTSQEGDIPQEIQQRQPSRQSNSRQQQQLLHQSRTLPPPQQESVNLAAFEPKAKKVAPQKPAEEKEVDLEAKYKYEPEGTIQYNIEQIQHVLAQDLLYSQLVQYERQHFEEMQEYMKQQEEVRRLEQQMNEGEYHTGDTPKELTFPDFTNFLYNKFLINGAPAAVENEITHLQLDTKKSPQKSGINLSTDTNPKPSPRSQFQNQIKNAPQFALYQKDPQAEVSKPPTQVILNQIQQSKENLRHHHDDSSTPLRIVPHTPSHMMRPVTQAAPRPIEETQEQETEQFRVKIDEIQRMVDKYERIKKDVEIERMRQEQRHVEMTSQEYMKSLKKVEEMVRDKDSERWRKKIGHSVNIGQQIVQSDELRESARAQSRQRSRQEGFRPKFMQKAAAFNVDLPTEEQQNYQPNSSMNLVDRELMKRSLKKELKDNPDFSRSMNNQSDELNIAESSYTKSFNKSMARTQNHSPESKKQLNQEATENRQVPKIELPQISQPQMRPQSKTSFLRDMIKDVPSINQGQQQSSTNKPPLPPISLKQSSFVQNSRNGNPLENSGYFPKNNTQQQVQLPPIRQNSFHSNDTDKSVIDIFNNEGGGNIRPVRQKKYSGSLSDIFEAPLSAKFDSKGDDPFSLRDRLRLTIQETHQMVSVDNINLLQKIKDFDRTIKPAAYENGLPPVIDLAYTGKQSSISIYNAPPQHAIVQPDPAEIIQEPNKEGGSFVMQGGFAGNFQKWDNKRAVIKHTEDRYNIRPSQVGAPASDQSFQNNEFVREIIQSRSGPGVGGMIKSVSTQKLQPIQGSTPKNMNTSQRMLPGMLGQSMEQQQRAVAAQLPSVSRLSQPKDSVASLPAIKKDQNVPKIPESIHESPASSIYDPESRRQSFGGGGVVYKVVEHTVETPRDMIFGIQKPSLGPTQQQQPEKTSSNGIGPFTNQSEFSPIRGEGQTSSSEFRLNVDKVPVNQSNDNTRQNVLQPQNIQENSPDSDSAHKWVTKWFNPDDMPSAYASIPKSEIPRIIEPNQIRASTPPAAQEKSPDAESAQKWVSKWFNPDDMPAPRVQVNQTKEETQPPTVDQETAHNYLSGLFSRRDFN